MNERKPDLTLEDLMEKLEIDATGVMNRFSNNGELYQRFLFKLPQDNSFPEAAKAKADGDWKRMETAVHTLKGVSANLGLHRICNASTELLLAIRNEELGRIDPLYVALEAEYNRAMAYLAP